MRHTLLVIALAICSSVSAEAQRSVCFQRGTDIWVAKIDGTGARKIARGSAPDISPDGTRVAFNTDSDESKKLERRIAVADIRAQKMTVFQNQIPSDNCQAAVWSPDGAHILFEIFTDSDWHVAMINADGSGFRYVKKSAPKNNSFWSISWAPDSQSFYAQDLNKLYQFKLDGSVIKQWSLQSLFPAGSFSSGSRIATSPDGKTLLMTVDMDEPVQIDDWDGGPPPTMWTLDLATQKATRLTPKGMFASDGCWLSADEVLFVTQGAKEKDPSIFRMSRLGQNRKLFLKNAQTPTVSR